MSPLEEYPPGTPFPGTLDHGAEEGELALLMAQQ